MQERAFSAYEVMKRVHQRFATEAEAREWFETEPLPGFGGATAHQLVADGRASDVLDFISATDAGIYS